MYKIISIGIAKSSLVSIKSNVNYITNLMVKTAIEKNKKSKPYWRLSDEEVTRRTKDNLNEITNFVSDLDMLCKYNGDIMLDVKEYKLFNNLTEGKFNSELIKGLQNEKD